MKLKTTTLAIAVCIPIGAGARAQELQAIPAGERLTPIRAAVLNVDGTMKTGWIDYRQALAQRGGVACSMTETLSYDCFQTDTDGVTAIGADIECGLATPDFRYFFGVDNCAQRTADDFSLEPGSGDEITRVTGAFYWYGDGNPANEERCYVAVQIWDTIDETCSALAVNDFLGGVIMDLGFLQNNPGSYYFFDFDVCALLGGVGIPSPPDGQGAVDLILGKEYDEMLGVTLATCAQPMLWGTAANRPGSQLNQPYWRDEDQSFTFNPATECYDMTGAVACPDNLGSTVALYTAFSDPCLGSVCGDANCDSLVGLDDRDPFIAAIMDPGGYAASFPGCDPFCTVDTNRDGVLNNFDSVGLISLLSGGSCDGFSNGPTETYRFFFAEEGLSNPADIDSPAVAPSLGNPAIMTDGATTHRLYLWVAFPDPIGNTIENLSLNVNSTGSVSISEFVMYNTAFESIGGFPWFDNLFPSTDTSGDGSRWSGGNAFGIVGGGIGLVNDLLAMFDPHYESATNATLVGHIEVQGVGEIFLEVGDYGISSGSNPLAPGPNINLGFGDEADGLNGADFATASSIADATLVAPVCVGDLNGDMNVDTADLGILLSQFGSPGSADLNNDGVVDTADLGILLSHFNTICGDVK
ncbi:MAG: hypothetical protein H6813_00320 [Phycisphaeraceae bacterium]|nr:hypothetical protein [Phycisphaeraceae bacterium]MCB9847471.1 hypothetical protein [Phycisphaeraceae bacterium]